MLISLLNLKSKDDFDYFAGNNAFHHRLIYQSIYSQQQVQLNNYVLFPVSEKGFERWLDVHQQAHDDFNQQLSLAGSDLSFIDFDDPRQVDDWAQSHYNEHLAAALALKIKD